MKITADTNVLVRAITGDDPQQSEIAQAVLANASVVALPLPVLCELVWVLSQGYKIPTMEVGEVIFVSFDRKAVKLIEAQGESARLLS